MISITDILDEDQITDFLYDEIKLGWGEPLFNDDQIKVSDFITDVDKVLEELIDWREDKRTLLNILDVLYKYKHGDNIECELNIFLSIGKLRSITCKCRLDLKRKLDLI